MSLKRHLRLQRTPRTVTSHKNEKSNLLAKKKNYARIQFNVSQATTQTTNPDSVTAEQGVILDYSTHKLNNIFVHAFDPEKNNRSRTNTG
jgi:light-regulated signal transduction histidine kinase (bacteriophytochrome)